MSHAYPAKLVGALHTAHLDVSVLSSRDDLHTLKIAGQDHNITAGPVRLHTHIYTIKNIGQKQAGPQTHAHTDPTEPLCSCGCSHTPDVPVLSQREKKIINTLIPNIDMHVHTHTHTYSGHCSQRQPYAHAGEIELFYAFLLV